MNVVRRCVRGVAAIVVLLCAAQAFSQYFVAYRPSGEMAPGQFRKIQMKALGHRGKIAYRGGYFVPNSN